MSDDPSTSRASAEESIIKLKRALGGDTGRFFNLVVFDETFEDIEMFKTPFRELVKKIDTLRALVRLFYWTEELIDFRLKDIDRWEKQKLNPGENEAWVKVFRRELIVQYKLMIKSQNDTPVVESDTNPIRYGEKMTGERAGDINDLFG